MYKEPTGGLGVGWDAAGVGGVWGELEVGEGPAGKDEVVYNISFHGQYTVRKLVDGFHVLFFSTS